MNISVQQQKKLVRKEARLKNKTLSQAYINSSNHGITQRVLQHPRYKKASVVFCFVSTPQEVDTHSILQHAWQQGKTVCVPLCTGPGTMQARAVTSFAQLQPGTIGILEPVSHTPVIDTASIDFAIVPCLTCDIYGNRVGYGGGYYDRFLLDAVFYSAVVCRQKLLANKVPTEVWDVPVNHVITELALYENGLAVL